MSAYYSKKLCDGIKVSARTLDMASEYMVNHFIEKNSIADAIHRCVESSVVKFLKKYEKHISSVCNNRGYYMRGEVEDCKQFVLMNLCKSYHKRHKYTNFDKVVKSIIKRKVIDFSKSRNNDLRLIVNESSLIGSKDSNMSLEKVAEEVPPSEYLNDVNDAQTIIFKVLDAVDMCEDMSKNDLRIASIIRQCVSEGEYDLDRIQYKISDNKYRATHEFGCFVGKISKYMDLGGFK